MGDILDDVPLLHDLLVAVESALHTGAVWALGGEAVGAGLQGGGFGLVVVCTTRAGLGEGFTFLWYGHGVLLFARILSQRESGLFNYHCAI